MKRLNLNPDERVVVQEFNRYKLIGPGIIWLLPWQHISAQIGVGVSGQPIHVDAVRTLEEVPVDINIQVLYQVVPELLQGMLHQVAGLNSGGWKKILASRAESVLRKLIAGYSWRGLNRKEIQERLERHFSQLLSEQMEPVGIRIARCYFVNVKLPDRFREAQERAEVLKRYADIFGDDLSQAMPDITKWELVSAMQKNGSAQVILATSDSSNSATRVDQTFPLTIRTPPTPS